MEDSFGKDISLNFRKVLETESLMNIIFDELEAKERLNLSLTCKKLYSFFQNRNKFLDTNIKKPDSNELLDIEIPLLNTIISKYKNIKRVDICFDKKKLKILDDAKLINLEILNVSCIRSNFNPFLNMTNLKVLDLVWNYLQDEITNLSFLLNFPNLEILKLSSGKVADIKPIKELKKLKELSIRDMSKGTKGNLNQEIVYYLGQRGESLDYTPISFCINLEKLDINFLYSIELIQNLINLKKLYLQSDSIEDISVLTNFVNLKKLKLSINAKNIEAIKYLTNLEMLYIYDSYLSDISALSNLKNLKELYLPSSPIEELELLKELKNLEILILSNNYCLNDISPLSNCTNLKNLDISKTEITDISSIKSLTKLEELNLEKDWNLSESIKKQLTNISNLSNLVNLKKLNLRGWNIIDITPLKSLINLKELDISSNRNISDISVLKNLINLEILDISALSLKNIEPLKGLIKLRKLDLSFNDLTDISPIISLINLEKLDLKYNYNLKNISLVSSLINLKELNGDKIDKSTHWLFKN